MEICVDNIQSLLNAYKGGASRIELCSALGEGGLTPSLGFLKTAKHLTDHKIPIFVMIRPRGGYDFNYSPEEVFIMCTDIAIMKENGADGFVFGLLTSDNEIDVPNCQKLLKLTGTLPCTFHRAFDVVKCPKTALESLVSLGFKRILTSGQRPKAELGISLIKELIVQSAGRIIVTPGSGVGLSNINSFLQINAQEIHGSLGRIIQIKQPNNIEPVFVGKDSISVTDEHLVRAVVEVIKSYKPSQ